MVFDMLYIYIRIAKLLILVLCEFVNFYCLKYINYLCKIPTNRIELIKKLSKKLEHENIVYVKVFQALCLDKDLLTNDEQDYLLKYTDNVPYKHNDIDYELLDKLEREFSITLKTKVPINCGIVGLVFDGDDSCNNKVIIKMLKKDILQRFTDVFNEMVYISYMCKIIPYIRSLKITKLLLDNKQILLNQMNFIKEVEALEIFSEKYKNNKEYIFPKVYREITEKYNNLLVMENISGLKFKDIETMSETIKEEFAYLLNKFGILGILYHSVIHCDLHSGNVFFYINNDELSNDGLSNYELSNDESPNYESPKYKLGIIDFGICCFPNKENQNSYYTFFNDIYCNQNYCSLEKLLYTIIEEKELYNSFDVNQKKIFIIESTNCIKLNTKDHISNQLLVDLSKLFSKYNLNFTEEFNKLILSLHTVNSFGKQLSKDLKTTQINVVTDLNKFNDLLCI